MSCVSGISEHEKMGVFYNLSGLQNSFCQDISNQALYNERGDRPCPPYRLCAYCDDVIEPVHVSHANVAKMAG